MKYKRCPKCSYGTAGYDSNDNWIDGPSYDNLVNRLQYTCKRCGFQWYEKPYDLIEEE